jgi:hypothetical protein
MRLVVLIALSVESSLVALLSFSHWMASGERLSAILGIAFGVMACNWLFLTINSGLEFGYVQSAVRIIAFILIVIGLARTRGWPSILNPSQTRP